MAKRYHAVKKGRNPGIYQTWDEAKAQVNGYSGAIYKSFATLQEADEFMLGSIEQTNDNKKNESFLKI